MSKVRFRDIVVQLLRDTIGGKLLSRFMGYPAEFNDARFANAIRRADAYDKTNILSDENPIDPRTTRLKCNHAALNRTGMGVSVQSKLFEFLAINNVSLDFTCAVVIRRYSKIVLFVH